MFKTPPRQPVVTRKHVQDGRQQFCAICELVERVEVMLNCESCKQWYHYDCANADRNVDWQNETFQCTTCVDNLIQERQNQPNGGSGAHDENQSSPRDQNELHPRNNVATDDDAVDGEEEEESAVDVAEEQRLQEIDEELHLLERSRQLLKEKREIRESQTLRNNINQRNVRLSRHSLTQQTSSHTPLIDFNQQPSAPPAQLPPSVPVASTAPTAPLVNHVPQANSTMRRPTDVVQRNANLVGPGAAYTSPTTSATQSNTSVRPNLTSQQLAARHSVPKDLPKFSGLSSEWPVFYSCYTQTTELCGFTDGENLIRLQKCLVGTARNLVEGQLNLPGCVPSIISTLKMVFGRPEYIVDDQLQQIRKIPPPKSDKLETVVTYAIAIKNMCATLEQCDMNDNLANPVLLRELVEKLPPGMKLNWVTFSRTQPQVTIKELSEWLHSISMDICSVTRLPLSIDNRSDKSKFKNIVGAHVESTSAVTKPSHTETSQAPSKCGLCQGSRHDSIGDCKKFHQLNLKQRWDTMRKFHLCRVCLRKHRPYCDATAHKCGVDGCEESHHTLLHYQKNAELPKTGTGMMKTQLSHRTPTQRVLCRIVPVVIQGPKNEIHTFAFLDSGSTITMIEDWLLKSLGVDGDPEPLHLRWTGNKTRVEENSQKVKLRIKGVISNALSHDIEARSVSTLALPTQSLNVTELKAKCPHLQKLPLKSCTNAQPAILIGLDNWRVAAPLETVEGSVEQPIATRSRLGWTVEGPWSTGVEHDDQTFSCHVHLCDCEPTNDEQLHTLIKSFYEHDHLPDVSKKEPFSMNDRKDLETLQRTVKYVNGRYQTGLLWKYEEFELPNSLPMAFKRWNCLERDLKKDVEKATKMNEQIQKFIAKGYARKLSKEELEMPTERVWYLPIFPVFNPNKPNKLRVVFDAAAKVNGVALNSFLNKGPDFTSSLYAILINFRRHKIGISGDIEEMFQRVEVNPVDQHVQRFLWCDVKENRSPDVYVLQVMTFGATCSPSIAQYVKNVNADRFADQFPRARDAIKQSTYADDTLDGEATEEGALQLALDIKYVHSQASFNIRNWRSNSRYVQQSLEPGSVTATVSIDTDRDIEKVLGMFWHTESDMWVFNLKFNKGDPEVLKGHKRATKRELLRIQMSIFDPLGLLAHYIIKLKILVQSLWRSGSDWDTEITDEQQNRFEKWLEHLPEVEHLRISRCYLDHDTTWENTSCQLHIFADASESAYASVAYLRLVTNGEVKCVLIGAKTRVAPVKIQSVPRMELNAARLGAQHGKVILESLKLPITKVTYWSDAKTVLIWLRGDARANPPYVAFRIGDIQDLSDVANWRYVPSTQNVADEATKEKETYTVEANSRWFTGPPFLYLPENEWPKDPTLQTDTIVMTHTEESLCWPFDPEKFSNWTRMVRVYSRVTRLSLNFKRKKLGEKLITGPLTANELMNAEHDLIKLAQQDEYPLELNALKRNVELTKGNVLLPMSPFIDDTGIMRAQSRLEACEIMNEAAKRPIILPRQHRVTELIMHDYHGRMNHILHETTMNRIRQRYWVPRLRQVYKRLRRNCAKCKINSTIPQPPRMGNLPSGRVCVSRPFTHVGVDYFGPFKIVIGRRVEKRYGVIFTCLSTRAVHIEIAHTLSTNSFILCYRSFINRRGMPRVIYSDCGTNFIGAEKELKNSLKEIDHTKIAEEFISPQLDWQFNPPSSPHMGGSWERLIRTIKTALYASVPETRLFNDEIFRSYLTEVEFTLNSRPLFHVPFDDLNEPLTPNHFLLGDSGGVKPMGAIVDDGRVLTNSWRRSQQLADVFWKRWINEYLPTVAHRQKWHNIVKPLEVGDIVIIVDDNLPRGSWLKGRIIQINKGKDEAVRSAVVQTKTGIYKRPATKIASLNLKTVNDASCTGGSVENSN